MNTHPEIPSELSELLGRCSEQIRDHLDMLKTAVQLLQQDPQHVLGIASFSLCVGHLLGLAVATDGVAFALLLNSEEQKFVEFLKVNWPVIFAEVMAGENPFVKLKLPGESITN